jgi:hypothetical protein
MKTQSLKLVAFLCLIPGSMLAQTLPVTPNVGLQLPPYNYSFWNIPLNYNSTLLDSLLSGVAPLPALSVSGALTAPKLTTWGSTVNYPANSIVWYLGSSYYALMSNSGTLPTNTTYWAPGTSATASCSGCLLGSNNLNDVASASAARTNLGLGSSATQPSTAYDPAGAATAAAQAAAALLTPIFNHTLAGASPTLVVNSATVPAIDNNTLVLTANVTSLPLPASTVVANGERINLMIMQAATGGPYTVAGGTVGSGSPLTAGAGTTIINVVPGGCPAIGTVVSSSAPSELLIQVQYVAALSQYQILSCQATNPTGLVEFALTTQGSGAGYPPVNTVLASTVAMNSGHIVNLQVVNNTGGSCGTPPTYTVFDGTTNIGTGVAGSTTLQVRGVANNQVEGLAFNAGDNIGIYIAGAPASCINTAFTVSAQIAEP